jgi:signal transduction histidine kinase
MQRATEATPHQEMAAALHAEQARCVYLEAEVRQLTAMLQERSDMLDVLVHEVRQPLNNASAALQNAAVVLAAAGELVASSSLTHVQVMMGQVVAHIENSLAVAMFLARRELVAWGDTEIDTLLLIAIADMPPGEQGRVHVRRLTSTRTASMDPGLMRLALRNLLSNALKFSPAGSPVWISLSDSDHPLALLIDVTDTGPGVAREALPGLFERKAPGQGLGLFIVRQVMALHGGGVEVVRSNASGTTLRLVVVQTDPAGDRSTG